MWGRVTVLEHRALQRKKSILSLVKKKEKALTGETMLFRGANAADTLEWIAGAFLSIQYTSNKSLKLVKYLRNLSSLPIPFQLSILAWRWITSLIT